MNQPAEGTSQACMASFAHTRRGPFDTARDQRRCQHNSCHCCHPSSSVEQYLNYGQIDLDHVVLDSAVVSQHLARGGRRKRGRRNEKKKSTQSNEKKPERERAHEEKLTGKQHAPRRQAVHAIQPARATTDTTRSPDTQHKKDTRIRARISSFVPAARGSRCGPPPA